MVIKGGLRFVRIGLRDGPLRQTDFEILSGSPDVCSDLVRAGALSHIGRAPSSQNSIDFRVEPRGRLRSLAEEDTEFVEDRVDVLKSSLLKCRFS